VFELVAAQITNLCQFHRFPNSRLSAFSSILLAPASCLGFFFSALQPS